MKKIKILLLLIFTHTQVTSVNEASRLALIQSLLERGRFWTDTSYYLNFCDMVFYQGHFYTDKALLLPLYSALLLYPFHLFIKFDHPVSRQILYYLVSLFSSGVSVFILYSLIKKKLLQLSIEKKAAKWTLFFIFFGSCLAPFTVVYNTHIVEALFLFICFHFMMRYKDGDISRGWLGCAVSLGISCMLNPFQGFLFVFLTFIYFSRKNMVRAGYLLCLAAAIFSISLGLNKLQSGTFRQLNSIPEIFLYKGSDWLKNPAMNGFTPELIKSRLTELGADESVQKQTLDAFYSLQKSAPSPWQFLVRQFSHYDGITFNPLFLIGLGCVITAIFSNRLNLRAEALWLGLGLAGLFLCYWLGKADPGNSFGNRYYIPVIPLVVFFIAPVIQDKKSWNCLKLVFWIVFASIAPGILHPWLTPGLVFRHFNISLYLYLSVVMLICYAWGKGRQALSNLFDFFKKNYFFGAFLVLFFCGFEFFLYISK